MNDLKKKKFNLYNLLNPETDKDDATDDGNSASLNLKWFFKIAYRRLSTILSANILFIIGNFPIIFPLLILSGAINDHSIVPQSLAYSNLYGALVQNASDPLTAVFYGVSGSPVTENEYNAVLLILFLALSALLLITFGPVNCGVAHILRSTVRREPVFLFDDFWGAIKRNYKQAIPLGIFDLLFLGVTAYDIWVFYLNYSTSFFYTVLFFFAIGVLITWLFARMYIYLLCITFDLKFLKLLKNSVIFAYLGFKRNIMALFGQLLLIFITILFFTSGVLMAIGAVLPFVILFGLALFMSYYAAYKVIRKYMIDPYYDEEGNLLPVEETTDTSGENMSSSSV